ncbi:MAG: mechanosensitive ion channel family protein, partial [Desulfuromonadales bacterium]|nr:mechanosensitive ion channel family protein [Desulfuromonadales bacterium]
MESISSDKLVELIQSYGLPIIWAIVVFVVGRIVARLVSNGVGRVMTKSKVDETLIKFAKNMIYVALMIFVILAALGKLGIETTSF